MKVLEINVDDIGMGGVFSLVRNVIAHRPSDMQIDIAAIELFEKEENLKALEKLGCHVHYIGFAKSKLMKQFIVFFRLICLIKKEKYSCVHIHADVANKLFVSALASRIAGIRKIILHSHAAGVDGRNRFLKRIYHKSCRYFLKFLADECLACSDLAAEWMFPNVKKSKIRMVNNGIDLDRFRFNHQIRDNVRKKMGLEKAFVVGHVGRFAYQKNHDYLVDVFARLKMSVPQARLLLIGEGELKETVERKVSQKGLSDSVVLYGVSNDIPSLMMAMDVFVLPSHFEGLPIVGVEAQATGLPVIFSDCITKSAKLSSNVYYLPINKDSIQNWVDMIIKSLKTDRNAAYEELFNRGFDIRHTTQSLVKIYEG
ncbi:multidrug MFS transporter [Fibrobacter sp. UWB1]|uniref:glycosyltransferase n=1 Tax=Fibrobacter sp. UWB1 TaxID=1964355 RepID=UPI000B704A7A|nr:glycosyltransferase [Fibrobacter sp. UWB1]OWV26221.1 multidrug MFS transporter [Fibrobacter sp. UWB1]